MLPLRELDPDHEAIQILRESPLLQQVEDEAWAARQGRLRWVEADAGQVLFREGDPGDGVYFLVRGRVEATTESSGGATVSLRWMRPGEPIGELAVLGGWPRSATARVVRRSQLAFLSREDFESWTREHPGFLLALSRVLVDRLRTVAPGAAEDGGARRRVQSILILPLCSSDASEAFAESLSDQLEAHGAVGRIDRDEALHHDVLTDRVDQLARSHRWVVLRGDTSVSAWNAACLELADLVLFVVATDQVAPALAVEAARVRGDQSQRRELVLLHPPGTNRPLATRGFLEMLPCQLHHHVRHGRAGDVARVARFAADVAVALVLGGGAARGAAHVGVMRALEELNIEIDLWCGTSIGSIVAGLGAMGKRAEEASTLMRRELVRPWMLDPTIPVRAPLGGRGMRRALRRIFGDRRVEDLWTPMFAVASSLRTAEAVIMREGPLAEATRISGSVPGVFPPAERDGDILADGMMVANVPVEELRRLVRCRIIAVNLIPAVDDAFASAEPSFGPRGIVAKLRSLYTANAMEIMIRSFVLGTSREAGRLAQSVDCYIEPAVGRYAFFNILALDSMEALGYEAARRALLEWKNEDP